MTWGQSQAADETSYLIHLVPLWTKVLFDDLALEDLVANSNDSIGVGLPLDKPFKVSVLALKILSFDEVYPQDTLKSRAEVFRSPVHRRAAACWPPEACGAQEENRELFPCGKAANKRVKHQMAVLREIQSRAGRWCLGGTVQTTLEPSPGAGPRATYAPGA